MATQNEFPWKQIKTKELSKLTIQLSFNLGDLPRPVYQAYVSDPTFKLYVVRTLVATQPENSSSNRNTWSVFIRNGQMVFDFMGNELAVCNVRVPPPPFALGATQFMGVVTFDEKNFQMFAACRANEVNRYGSLMKKTIGSNHADVFPGFDVRILLPNAPTKMYQGIRIGTLETVVRWTDATYDINSRQNMLRDFNFNF